VSFWPYWPNNRSDDATKERMYSGLPLRRLTTARAARDIMAKRTLF